MRPSRGYGALSLVPAKPPIMTQYDLSFLWARCAECLSVRPRLRNFVERARPSILYYEARRGRGRHRSLTPVGASIDRVKSATFGRWIDLINGGI